MVNDGENKEKIIERLQSLNKIVENESKALKNKFAQEERIKDIIKSKLTVEEKEKELKDHVIKIIVKEKDEKINQLVLNKNAEILTGAALMKKVEESEKDISIKKNY
jgi:hypothetical protein